MADHQRIHPVEVYQGAPPPRPSAPLGSILRLDKGEPQGQGPRHIPIRRNVTFPVVPPPPPPRKKKRSCLCKCICWTLGLLILLLIIIGATIGILYLVFQPKLPKYSVDNLRISDLTLNFDLSLYARFNVKITAYNPNKNIGIYYEKGSHLSVWYKNINLCQGSIPRFYQGYQNKTVLNVALSGQNQYGRTLLKALQEEQQTGRIPLDLKINEPVSIKLKTLKLRKVKIIGTCKLIVDSLSTDSIISIKASTCNFGLKL
ncbi:NDR1 HIN1 6 [Olea europaea subsp. europaea]|uniref:NDR1 HIN1 6 n=1 Tax=Olea europaea subsp. europaea TaxID=158383 RepID=A0A8S0PCR9_OLEEU|nr:NDR1 HIN1 6 [Olea europaea subsp. europaea]